MCGAFSGTYYKDFIYVFPWRRAERAQAPVQLIKTLPPQRHIQDTLRTRAADCAAVAVRGRLAGVATTTATTRTHTRTRVKKTTVHNDASSARAQNLRCHAERVPSSSSSSSLALIARVNMRQRGSLRVHTICMRALACVCVCVHCMCHNKRFAIVVPG